MDGPLDPSRLLADTGATAAMARLATCLRAARWQGERADDIAEGPERAAASLARGEPVGAADAAQVLGDDGLDALRAVGAVGMVEPSEGAGQIRLGATLFPTGRLLSLVPDPGPGLDTVYLGPDTVLLFEVIWERIGLGRRAADLACGNGYLAAALATRFDHVVATDISQRCVAAAACVPVLNPQVADRFATVRSDVASGLRPRSFDVVTANAPWVPEQPATGTNERLFAAGGPTGFELPRRFLDDAVELLAPDGRAFVACIDLELDDGRRPLRDHLPDLERREVTVEVVPTRLGGDGGMDSWARQRNPSVATARHVVVVLHATS
jgi:SAM-dependent methyltransferase